MVRLLAGAFPIIMESKKSEKFDDIKHETMSDLLAKLRHFISLICNIPSLAQDTVTNLEVLDLGDSFPIPHQWQTNAQKLISLRVYNLCVSCNVSAFSGWESEEFSLNHLQKGNEPSFFGIKVGGEHVAGFVDQQFEDDLSSQWKLVDSLLFNAPLLDFDSSLFMAKKATWYTAQKTKLDEFKDKSISTNGESYCIFLLLLYSRICLLVASSDENRRGDELLKEPLSIILPMVSCPYKQG